MPSPVTGHLLEQGLPIERMAGTGYRMRAVFALSAQAEGTPAGCTRGAAQ